MSDFRQKDGSLIIGGNYVGLMCALWFQNNGMPYSLIEKKSFENTSSDDGKTFAISRFASEFLGELGIWEKIYPHVQPINSIHVFEHGQTPHLSFRNETPLGFMCPSHVLKSSLLESLDAPNSQMTFGARWGQIVEEDNLIFVRGENAEGVFEICAKILLACDGKDSAVAKSLGVRKYEYSYNQSAILFEIEHEVDHCGAAVEKFFPEGPLAVLPLSGGFRSSIVWINGCAQSKRLRLLSLGQLEDLLGKRLGFTLGAVKIRTEVRVYNLDLAFARELSAGRTLLVGDALHAIHPVAGQGLNITIGDLGFILPRIKSCYFTGSDPLLCQAFQGFYAKRMSKNLQMVGFTHILNEVFSTKFPPLRRFRNGVIGLISNIAPLSNFMKKRAMGYS